jgi:hypothetical protein
MFLIFLFIFAFSPLQTTELQTSINVSRNRLMVDESLTLTVTLKGLGVERIQLPALFPPGFTVIEKSDKPSLSQDAFGRPVSGRILRYKLQPTVAGRFRLGAFTILYGGQPYKVAGEQVEVQDPSGNSRPPRLVEPANFEPAAPIDVRLLAEVDRQRVYVGERIVLSIRITHNSSEVDDIRLVDLPQFTNFWNKEIFLTRHVNPAREIQIKGRPYITQLIPRFVLYPATSGKLAIPSLTYSMLAHGRSGRQTSPNRPLLLKTAPITVEVLPLPETGKPAEFRGAVGRYKFKAELKDRVSRVGTPTRLLIEIEAEGNLDALTPPPLPPISGVKIYELNRVVVKSNEEQTPPKAQWEADIVPTIAGQLTIPPIIFAYFDPVAGSYQVLKSEPLHLEVASAGTSLPVVSQPLPSSILMRIFSSTRTRYSLIALVLVVGLGLVFVLVKRQKSNPEVSEPPEPEANPVEQEIRKIVNSSYGKLHRGDERAYSGDLLRAIRLIFESYFSIQSSELTIEKINQLLRDCGANEATCHKTVSLYQECERISFSPVNGDSSKGTNFSRFNEARAVIFDLLEISSHKGK